MFRHIARSSLTLPDFEKEPSLNNPYDSPSTDSHIQFERPSKTGIVSFIIILIGWFVVVMLLGLATNYGLTSREDLMEICVKLMFAVWVCLGVAHLICLPANIRANRTTISVICTLSLLVYIVVSTSGNPANAKRLK